MTTTGDAKRTDFEDFSLDPIRRRLLCQGEEVAITAKALDCLIALIEHRDRVLTRAELMDRVWPQTHVEEANLTQTISMLRKALGEGAKDHRFIVTVPGRGYRFVAEIRSPESESRTSQAEEDMDWNPRSTPMDTSPGTSPVGGPTAEASGAVPGLFRGPIVLALGTTSLLVLVLLFQLANLPAGDRSRGFEPSLPRELAVLPFTDLGGQPIATAAGGGGSGNASAAESDPSMLGLAMADAVINRASRVPSLTVRPTSAVLPWAEGPIDDPVAIGNRLRVGAVLVGTLQHRPERVRVSVQLVDVETGNAVWAGTFEAPGQDPFRIQDTISEELVRALSRELEGAPPRTPAPPSRNPRAYEAYLAGRIALAERSSESMALAERHFARSIELDPDYALAHLGMADTLLLRGSYGHGQQAPRAYFERARTAASKALRLHPSLGEAHATLGWLRYQLDLDYTGAEELFARAVSLAPGAPRVHHWYGWLLLARGKEGEARAAFERARELDPLSLIRTTALGMHAFHVRDWTRARSLLEGALRIDADFSRGHIDLGLVLEALGEADAARHHLERARVLLDHSSESLAALGHLAAKQGDSKTWKALLEELRTRAREHYVSPYHLAYLHVAAGDTDSALDALDRAIDDRAHWPAELRYDPRFDPLRGLPRFAALLRKAGLDGGSEIRSPAAELSR